jgi:hypothetical protein
MSPSTKGATMLADLDLLLTAVFVTADDLLPRRAKNARRRITDAEVITLCVAQALLGISSDRRFLRAARSQLAGLFSVLPAQDAYWKRRARLADQIEQVMAAFARDCPGYWDQICLLDSTPVECGRSVETTRRSQLADACAHHYSRSHSRWFWGFRLHLACSPDGTPRAAMLVGADRKEREIARKHLLPRLAGSCHTIVADKGYAGRELADDAQTLGITIIRPRRANEPKRASALRLTTIRQRIESVFWTLKDLLSLEQHGARTLHNLRARIGCRLLCLAACVNLNHQLGRPTRSLANYTA